jgi:hypothetical protein
MATAPSLRDRRRLTQTRPPRPMRGSARIVDPTPEAADPPLLRTILVLYAALIVVVAVIMTLAFAIAYLFA